MNNRLLIVIVSALMIVILTGCTNLEYDKYSHDYNKVSEISTIELAILDAYHNSGSKNKFKKEAKKLVKDLDKTKMKTKEGKDILNVYLERAEYLVDILVESWNKGVIPNTEDKKIVQLEANLEDKMNKFDEKIEELKVESGLYEMLEELK